MSGEECGSCGVVADGAYIDGHPGRPIGFMCNACWDDFWGDGTGGVA